MTATTQILTALIFLSAGFTIWGEETERRRLVYIFKPLTTTLIFALAVTFLRGCPSPYAAGILLGLIFSLAGDVFLMLPGDKFLPGLVSFLLAHLAYIFAFSQGGSFRLSVALLPFVLYGGLIFWFLYPGLGKLKAPVALYIGVILVMAWQAWAFFYAVGTPQAAHAFWGALLFVLSDSLLAVNRFRQKLPLAKLWILGTYFTAQWLIALSLG
jgi:uncharacterized membrane protein YhhN